MKKRTTAIVLAAGQGKRMQSKVQKQYMLLENKPVLYYALKTFQESFIDHIILVVGKDEQEYCQKEIVNKFDFHKVRVIVEGGKERYHSVANGIQAISWENDIVFIHDGARPFVTEEILQRAYDEVEKSHACVVGMPVKDTVKIVDGNQFVTSTPVRANVWQVQTPQVFDMKLIAASYRKLIENEKELLQKGVAITDDAMVVEYFSEIPIRLVEGSYQNIKITTPEDLDVAKVFLTQACI